GSELWVLLGSVAVQIHLRPPSCGPGSASSPPSLSGCLRFRYVGLSQHTDLSSIRSLAENMNIGSLFGNLLGGSYSTSTSPTSAWIGLHRSLWAWSDGSSAAFRQFGLVQSNGRDDCVLMDSSSSTWFWRPCTEYHPFLSVNSAALWWSG
uniref:C-type lectin domain-containing protein n=1 Tax=Oryzias latipes TaxID=8090 RepID=A0A3P9JHP9_ORYLA